MTLTELQEISSSLVQNIESDSNLLQQETPMPLATLWTSGSRHLVETTLRENRAHLKFVQNEIQKLSS